MEGVLGIVRASDLPGEPGPRERALTDEPKYEGEPILAVAAVDETTAAAAVEAVKVDLEQLPFVLDPLESLREGGPDARLDGNVVKDREVVSFKWPDAVFDEAGEDRLPMGEPAVEWAVGDVEAGFAEAAVVVEETIVHQSVTHHPMEPRSCMAYWQNGKLFLHGSTQSTQQARNAVARMMELDAEDVVLVAEYCGGGFGSKIAGAPIMTVPAVLSRKIGRPVMLRITRYEENYIGRARAGFQGWAKIGFRGDGRMTALDLYLVQDSGPYGASDFATAGVVATASYQPENMRFRGVPVYTNTPPRSAQRAPGGAQIVAMLEPLVDKAARELDVDRLEIRKVNAADADGWLGPNQGRFTSARVREALELGGELFDWEEKRRLSGRREGTKLTGVGIGLSPFTAGSSGRDGLLVVRDDGKLHVHQGIGNLGTHSIADTARAAAKALDLAWDQVEIVWGDSRKHLPHSTVQAGSQTTFAHTRANHAAAEALVGLLQELAARELGGSPSSYRVADGRVFRAGNRSVGMDFAQAARRAVALGGKFSGEEYPGRPERRHQGGGPGLGRRRTDRGGQGQLPPRRRRLLLGGLLLPSGAGRGDRRGGDCGPGVVRRVRNRPPCTQLGGPDQRRRHPGDRNGEEPALGVRPQVGHPLHQALLHRAPAGNARRSQKPALRRGGPAGPPDAGGLQGDRRASGGRGRGGVRVRGGRPPWADAVSAGRPSRRT